MWFRLPTRKLCTSNPTRTPVQKHSSELCGQDFVCAHAQLSCVSTLDVKHMIKCSRLYPSLAATAWERGYLGAILCNTVRVQAPFSFRTHKTGVIHMCPSCWSRVSCKQSQDNKISDLAKCEPKILSCYIAVPRKYIYIRCNDASLLEMCD